MFATVYAHCTGESASMSDQFLPICTFVAITLLLYHHCNLADTSEGNVCRRVCEMVIYFCIIMANFISFLLLPVVVYGGFVQLRNWTDKSCHGPRKPAKPRSAKDAKLLVKTKPCWFHEHHPQGCPRLAENCPYAHGQQEIRDRPNFSDVTSIC